jgi:cytoskeleton protein RodZ
VAAVSSPAAAAAIGAGTVVVVIAAVAIAGLGDHGGARTAPSKPPPPAVRRPAAAPTTTTPTPTTVAPARVTPVVSRSTGGGTVSVHSPFRMTLHATGTCWVEITDPTGRSLFTGTLRSGQNQLIPSRGPIVVRLGYTPAITIAVDGVDLDLSGLAQTTSINFQST